MLEAFPKRASKGTTMKHLILGTLLSLATAAPAFAQHGDAGVPHRGGDGATHQRGPRGFHGHHGRRHHDPDRMIGRMTQDLALSPAQADQIRRIVAESRARREAQRGERRSPEARQARRAAMQATRARIDAVLTPQQRERASQLRRERQEAHLERRLGHMTERLSLRPDQVQQIRRIFQQAQQQHQALGRGPEPREAHRALRERTMAEVDAVLDAQQRAQAQQMRERRGHHGRGMRHRR